MVKKISDKRKTTKQRRIKKKEKKCKQGIHISNTRGVGKGCFAIHLANFVKKGRGKKKRNIFIVQ